MPLRPGEPGRFFCVFGPTSTLTLQRPPLSPWSGEPGSEGGGVIQVLRSLEVQLNLIMRQEEQMAAGMDGQRLDESRPEGSDRGR